MLQFIGILRMRNLSIPFVDKAGGLNIKYLGQQDEDNFLIIYMSFLK